MANSINFDELKKFDENKSATIQFSYPAVDNVQLLADGSFFLPNNSVTPNFSYTDGSNNLYISGAILKGYIITNSSYLVLKHQSVNSDKNFYVVIPLEKSSKKSTSTLSKLNIKSKVSLDLNSDIPTNQNIYHYLSSGKEHVFVFEKKISTSLSGISSSLTFPASDSQKYKIMRNTKVEDEIVCGYSEDAEATPAKENKIVTTTSYSIAMFLINIVIIMIALHIIGTYGEIVSSALFVVTSVLVIIFAVLIYLYRTHVNYLIIFGSLGATFVIVSLLSLLSLYGPFKEWFVTKVLPNTPPTVTSPKRSGTPAFLSF